MEYSIGSGEYSDVANPDLSGDKTVRVRVKDDGFNGAGLDRTLTFTTNPVTPARPSVTADDTANRIIGLDLTTMEYAIGSGAYTQAPYPDLFGNKTVRVRIAAADINPASDDTILIFTTDPITPDAPSVTADDDANTIIDLNLATMEYAIGLDDYTNVANPNLKGDKTVKVRVAAVGINPASADTILIFHTNPVTPARPSVTADDDANTIIDLNLATMQYAIGSGEYSDVANPDLSGDKTVKVRVKAAGINPASADTILVFTTNPVKPSAPVVSANDTTNVIEGLDLATMEYAIGSNNYTQAANPDLSGDKTVKVRVAAAGINPVSDGTILIFTTNPVTPAPPSVTADDTANVINGLNLATMEYAIGSGAYTQALYPDLFGNKTVKVRVKAAGINPASADTILVFTTNPVKPSAPFVSADDTANVIEGLDLATMEYAIGSGAYTQALYPDLFGNKTVKVRIKDDGVNGAGWEITLTFTTNPVKPSAPFVSADDTANVIEGLDLTTMEYAIGSSPYSQDPSFDFSGDKTVHVRMKDDGVNGAGWDITLTFTTNPVAPQAPILNRGVDEVQETPVKQPDNQEVPKTVSIRPTSIVQSDPPVTRPEDLVSESSLSAEELAQSEKRSAALLAAKQARSQARALAAEKRRIQLEALGTKLAATKARGEALKQTSSWINLMKDFRKL
jgi:predicted transcriptional regulator